MSGHIPARLAREVRQRAADTCEYCRLPQASQEATFHIDHIVPRSHGGETVPGNLALACVSCSLHKAARIRARDPRTGRFVSLYNPRAAIWGEHFSLTNRHRISGRTAVGRATVEVLAMNRDAAIAIRKELLELGRISKG